MSLRQKNKNVYFTGKVLNIKEDANDNAKSFRFSKEERETLNLSGIPIQLEHNDKLKVGTIEKSWQDNDGQFWVFGAIDQNSIEGTFAKHAIQKNNVKTPYYTGLSLSHVHRQFPDGKCEKVPIEVSLCTEPRRANCNIIWTSNKNDTNLQTNKVPYKPVVEKATKNKMSAVTEKQTPQQTPPQTAATMEVEQPQTTEPTGKELSEQVYNQFAELVEKEKGQQAKIEQLEDQLKKHNANLEVEKKKKADEDAAKGRALMQTFIEHINDLVGPEESNLGNDIEPLIAQPGMNRVMEIVARASKKYKEQSMQLKETQNDLKDKELELKFQTLIKQSVAPQQVVEHASKKRKAPVEKVVVQATKQTYNPYAFKVQGSSSRIAPRANMNEALLNAYKANKGAGMGAAKRLHNSFKTRPKAQGPMW
jgi:hypothetical protein